MKNLRKKCLRSIFLTHVVENLFIDKIRIRKLQYYTVWSIILEHEQQLDLSDHYRLV